MKKLRSILVLIIFLFSLNGCWDKRELEDSTFVVLFGMDKSEDKNIIISVAFSSTQTEGGGANEGMDNGSGQYTVMSVKASNIIEGLHMFSTNLSSPLSLYTVKTVVISRELAESEMLSSIFSSWNYNEIRNTTNIIISECNAVDFINARLKDSPVDILRQEDLLLEQINNNAYYKPIQSLEFFSDLNSDNADGIAMLGGVADDTESAGSENNKGSKTNIKEDIKDGYLPGEIPVSANNKSQISGLAVFRNAVMVGTLNSSEAQTYSILTGGRTSKILTLPDPLDSEYNITVIVSPFKKNEINSSIRNNIPFFDININLKCTVQSVQSGIDYTVPENHDILTGYIKDVCMKNTSDLIIKIQKEYKSDILKLGNKLAYNFNTVSEWENYDWAKKYSESDIYLNINLDIERTGIMK